MRLLAFSDIHDNLVAVRRLRALETNRFDAIIVAGDIGNKAADAFFRILATFECPVVYVYGNWDSELDYAPIAPGATLLHQTVVSIGDLHVAGFAGCPTRWGRNPFAVRLGAEADPALASRVLEQNRRALRETIATAKIDPRRTIVVTHERQARLNEIAPDMLMHLYGHIHGFAERDVKGTRFVNVSVLDLPVTAHPRALTTWSTGDLRNYNAGNYVVIEVSAANDVSVHAVPLPCGYPDWTPIADRRHRGLPWIPEEAEWIDAADPRLRRYQEALRG